MTDKSTVLSFLHDRLCEFINKLPSDDYTTLRVWHHKAADLIEQQAARIAELEAERDWLNHKSKCLEMERVSQEDCITAAQARVKSLHEALWKAHGLLAKMNIPMISDALDVVDDTAALDARLAQEREKCAELLLRTDLKNLPDEWKQAAATALQAYATAIREIT